MSKIAKLQALPEGKPLDIVLLLTGPATPTPGRPVSYRHPFVILNEHDPRSEGVERAIVTQRPGIELVLEGELGLPGQGGTKRACGAGKTTVTVVKELGEGGEAHFRIISTPEHLAYLLRGKIFTLDNIPPEALIPEAPLSSVEELLEV